MPLSHLQPSPPAVPMDVLAALRDPGCPSVVTIGAFDGVHHGHRALVGRARELARAGGRQAVAVTFSPRPEQVFAGGGALPDICTLEQRVERPRAAGAHRVVVVPFSRARADVGAADFRMTTLCVGKDLALVGAMSAS